MKQRAAINPLIKVVLPAPNGPSSATISPALRELDSFFAISIVCSGEHELFVDTESIRVSWQLSITRRLYLLQATGLDKWKIHRIQRELQQTKKFCFPLNDFG